MCTLIVASRVWPNTPLLVAANRDERLDRPAVPPILWSERKIPVIAPKDLSAGGTWIGINQARVFAGLTNRYGTPPDPSRRSRGEIVLDALEEPSAERGARRIAQLDPGLHNPFHLLVADASSAFLVVGSVDSSSLVELSAGIHIATERSFNTGATAREALIRSKLGALERANPPSDRDLIELLSLHGEPSIDGVSVYVPELNYGTRSSSILRLGEREELLHAEGRPESGSFVPVPLEF
jgi:uncharacterized protein with NRDE domain